jgi:hypothetical protein
MGVDVSQEGYEPIPRSRKWCSHTSCDVSWLATNGPYAFVVGDDSKAEMRNIKIGQEDDDQAVVLQGLSPGEKVVTAGQYRVQQAALVQPGQANPARSATGRRLQYGRLGSAFLVCEFNAERWGSPEPHGEPRHISFHVRPCGRW